MEFLEVGELEARLRADAGIGFHGTSEFVGRETLFPSEAAYVERAAAKRVADFATGRWCARRALAALGEPECAIGIGPGREPLWASGIVGSISHTLNYCCAAVSREKTSLGLDVQNYADAVRQETWKMVLTREENSQIDQFSLHESALRFGFFSAKEAFFKFIYPEVRRYIDFRDVHVRLDEDGPGIVATIIKSLTPTLPAGARFPGRLYFTSGFCLSIFTR